MSMTPLLPFMPSDPSGADESPRHTATASAPPWQEGAVFRDRLDRSLTVIAATRERALVEYADGRVVALDVPNWQALQPRPARF
jgi:hypothetical protein